jgi:hypothetical protein
MMAKEWRDAICVAIAADSCDVALAENQCTGSVSHEKPGGAAAPAADIRTAAVAVQHSTTHSNSVFNVRRRRSRQPGGVRIADAEYM